MPNTIADALTSRFRTPDGGNVVLTAPGYDLSEPWSASIRVRTARSYTGLPSPQQLRQFHITTRGNYDHVLRKVIEGHWAHRASSQGGQFLVGHSDTADQGLAIWRGEWHEVATWLGDPKLSGSAGIRMFERLGFDDAPDGLVVTSSIPEIEAVEVTDVSKHIPEVGFLDIRPPMFGKVLVPTWAGARVRTGELWRQQVAEADEPSNIELLHASGMAVTTLTGLADDKGHTARRIRFLEQVEELSWTTPGTERAKERK